MSKNRKGKKAEEQAEGTTAKLGMEEEEVETARAKSVEKAKKAVGVNVCPCGVTIDARATMCEVCGALAKDSKRRAKMKMKAKAKKKGEKLDAKGKEEVATHVGVIGDTIEQYLNGMEEKYREATVKGLYGVLTEILALVRKQDEGEEIRWEMPEVKGKRINGTIEYTVKEVK